MDPPFFHEIGVSDKLWTNFSLRPQRPARVVRAAQAVALRLPKDSVVCSHSLSQNSDFAFAFQFLQYNLFQFKRKGDCKFNLCC
ncbi:unnamed protein product [Urochloa humidicola]